jgi:DNA polymerase III gamma/tau subunit
MGLNSDIKRLVLEKDEVAFKKIELQAEADRLGYDFSEVGIKVDMLEAEIDNLEFSVEEMPVRKAFLEADKNRLDYEYNEVPVRVSDLEAETARLKTQKGYEVLTESEKDVAIAKTTAAQAEVASLKLREPLGDKRIAAADDEISKTIPKLSTAIADERAADLDAQAARNEHTVAEYGTRKTSFDTKVKTSGTVTKLTTDSHVEEAKQIKDNAGNTQDYYAAVQAANKARNDAAFAYAEAIQKANIVNTMTHQIGVAK